MKKIKIANTVLTGLLVINSIVFILPTVGYAQSNKQVEQNTVSSNKLTEIEAKQIQKFDEQLKVEDKKTSPVYKDITQSNDSFDIPQISGSVRYDEKSKSIKAKLKGKSFEIVDVDTTGKKAKLVKGKLIRTSSDGEVSSSIEAVEGGFRAVLSIGKTKSMDYSYDFPIKSTDGLKYVADEKGNISIRDTSNQLIAYVLQPWATDAKGKSVKTWYSIQDNGKILRQHVNLRGASFPVIADPAWCGDTITNATWMYATREGGNTLSINPSWCGRAIASYNQGVFWAQFVWNELQTRFYSEYSKAVCSVNNTCTNTQADTMWNQLVCHMNIVGAYGKNNWNLEPWKRNESWMNQRMSVPYWFWIPGVGYGWQCNPS